ncbi:hypothetical protein A5787_03295 [Mycobacterium sp. 852002-50816_SCH5313054-b]|uniref:hypothetical protein n=1 Tax=Mycobacterium sp. 852002-50816_SCH5313054-b TaxID=1834092 RepID=UPI0007FEE8A3|nr:hypothetical protein [Mycobacterium sp. 852002-50816_SCH5313054-b]OBF55329.1 hypothetical protein A5787_03295 [Mycobacterium sp. 852002-50816_SCH5313054-b]
MTNTTNDLTLGAKINRLFYVCRSRNDSEQSVDTVATAVSEIIGRPVSAAQINALRNHDTTVAEPDLIRGLISHFGIPGEYLTTMGPRAERLDKQLQLLAAARDAGVKQLALRGVAAEEALDEMLDIIKRVPAEENSSSGMGENSPAR